MTRMAYSKFIRLSASALKDALPLEITLHGKVIGVMREVHQDEFQVLRAEQVYITAQSISVHPLSIGNAGSSVSVSASDNVTFFGPPPKAY